MLFFEKSIRNFLLLAFFLLPIAHIKAVFFGMPLYAIEVPILLAASLYLFGIATKRLSRPSLAALDPWLAPGAGAFFLGAIISFLSNPFSLTGLGMLKTWFFFPLLAAFLWVQTDKDGQADGRQKLLAAWFLSMLGVALASLWFLWNNVSTYDGRLGAWYASPNFLAIFIAPGILLAGYHLYSLRQRDTREHLAKFFLLLASMIVFSTVLFFTQSYGVWAGVFIASAVLFFPFFFSQQDARKKFALGAILLLALGSFIALESGTAKWRSLVSREERSSLSSRMMIWQAAEKMIADRPLSGIGVGRFQEEYLAYQKYFPPYLEWAVPQPHNLFLAVWLQTGLIGFIGFLVLVLRAGVLLCQAYRKASDENGKMSVTIILSLLVLTIIYGLSDTPYFKNDLAFLFWMLVALIAEKAYLRNLANK